MPYFCRFPSVNTVHARINHSIPRGFTVGLLHLTLPVLYQLCEICSPPWQIPTPVGDTRHTLQGDPEYRTVLKSTVIGVTLKPLFFFFFIKKCSKKISKDLEELNTIISQLDLVYISRTPIVTAEEAFFSSIHRTFTTTEHILGHKTHLDKHKGTEIIKRMCSDHKVI